MNYLRTHLLASNAAEERHSTPIDLYFTHCRESGNEATDQRFRDVRSNQSVHRNGHRQTGGDGEQLGVGSVVRICDLDDLPYLNDNVPALARSKE